MARPGVTYIDISKAAKALKSQGVEPTVDRIRNHLGTGSKSTISPLLKQWKTSENDRSDTHGLPEDLIDALKNLHESMQSKADAKIEAIAIESHKKIEEISDKLAEEKKERLSAEKTLSDEQKFLALAKKEIHELEKRSHDAEHQLSKAASENGSLTNKLHVLSDTNTDLKEENRNVREHFEHYQEQISLDRQNEREQVRQISHTQQEHIQSLTESKKLLMLDIERIRVENNTLLDNLTSKQLNIDRLLVKNKSLSDSLTEGKAKISTLESDMLNAKLSVKEMTQKHERLAEELVLSDKRNDRLATHTGSLQAQLDKVLEQQGVFQDRYESLLQEKSVLQGQLMQAQKLLESKLSSGHHPEKNTQN